MTLLSGKYEAVDLGQYVVANNAWNSDLSQTIETTATGFKVVTADGSVPLNGPPKSYPSIYYGVHWGRRSPGTLLPAHVDTDFVQNMTTSVVALGTATGVFDVAYDIWFDKTPKLTGQNDLEIMVWFHRSPGIQPVGSKVETVGDFEIWHGNIGWDVVSCIANDKTVWGGEVAQLFEYCVTKGWAQKDMYLTSVQFGMEPWVGGAGFEVRDFKVYSYGTVGDPMLPEEYGKKPEGLQ